MVTSQCAWSASRTAPLLYEEISLNFSRPTRLRPRLNGKAVGILPGKEGDRWLLPTELLRWEKGVAFGKDATPLALHNI